MRMAKAICDDRGATAVEYALLAAFIALAVIGTVQQVGDGVERRWAEVADEVAKN